MAVYTVLDAEEIQTLIAPFQLGHLVSARGITEGVENTTYFVTTASGAELAEYVLTIAESQNESDLLFIAQLTATLQQHGLPVPAPVASPASTVVVHVQGKPAVLIPKIAGAHPLQPNLLQCREIGRALGKFHRVTTATELSHISCRSLDWVAATGARLLQQPSFADRELLSQEMAYLQRFVKAHTGLPQAIIHGDLFRDNTLFLDNRLTAIIDFFSAGQGFLMFDLAVVANDWCVEADGRLDPERLKTLLHSYSEARPPTAEEWTLWPDFLRIAALRFWVSRLAEKSVASTRSQPGTLQPEKDPNQYRKILTLRISSSFSWPL